MRIAIVLVLLTLGGGCTTNTLPSTPVEPITQEETQKPVEKKSVYSIVELPPYDSKILEKKANGEEVVLVESVRSLLPKDAPENLTLRLVSTVDRQNYMIFQEQLMETEDQGGKLWKFSLSTSTWTELKAMNEKYVGWGARVWNDLGDKLYFVPDQEVGKNEGESITLWEGDLTKEGVRTLTQLEEGETFNGGYGALSSSFDMSWHVPNEELSLAVFAQRPEAEGEKVRKEYRVFPVQNEDESK